MLKTLFIFILTPFFGFSQNLLEKNSVKEQMEDFEILKTTLLENHSGIYDYNDTLSFNSSILALKESLSTPQSKLNQIALYKKFVTSINCIHTEAQRKNLNRDINQFKYALPFSTYFINGKLYVSSNYKNGSKITKQDEILAINGESITTLTSILHNYIPSDGNNITRKNQVLKYKYLLYYFLLKQKETSFHLTYTHQGDTLENDFPSQLPNPVPKTKKEKHESISYSIDSIKSYAILTPPFPLRNSSEYKEELYSFFTLLKSKNINNLILDLRNNGGGNSQEYLAGFFTDNSYCMMTYTTNNNHGSTYKKHFKHRFSLRHVVGRLIDRMNTSTITAVSHPIQFKGNLSVLINGNTASAASNLASSLKDWSNAFIVGEESGGGYRGCNSGNLILELPNSKTQVLINLFKAKNTTLNDYENDGVSPDVKVLEPNFSETMEDLQLNYILENLTD